MSFAKEHGMVKKIKKYLSHLFRSPQKTAPPAEQLLDHQATSTEEHNSSFLHQDSAPLPTENEGAESEQGGIFDHTHDPVEQSPQEQEEPEERPDDDLVIGGIYAIPEQDSESYWLAKVIYIEEQVVHLICYAERLDDLSHEVLEQDLTIDLNREKSTFGLAHLPLPRADFATNAILLGQGSLTDNDFAEYQVYVDSVFDCLDEQAPDWLKKAGSYAAWRYDRHAMAALVDRYLIGVDLLRDSKKSLYWLNRLVHAGKGAILPGKAITKEQEILTGGIYAYLQEEERYQICKIVLKDKHGVQRINFPSLLGQLPENSHPHKIIEQVATRRAGQPPSLSHATWGASSFLAQSPIFLGLLPITLNELHCYRAHLRKMFDGAAFRESAWDNLMRKAKQGEAQAQVDTAYRYLDGDPLWEVQRNIAEAIRWFTEAANQGHSLAAYSLARLFQQGEEGVQPDPQLGFEWLAYSAQLNYGVAQLRTADCYHQGKGCPADAALAHAWYSLAITADNNLSEKARNRAKQRKYELEGTCSAEQLTKAKHYFLQLQAPRSEESLSQENIHA